MEKIKKILKDKIMISPLVSFIMIFILSFLLTGFLLWLQPDGLRDMLACLYHSKFLNLFLNMIPIFLTMILLYFITSNFVISVGLSSFVFIVMNIVNRFKILYRNDPFLPWDISLGGELMGIIKSFGMGMIITYILLIIAYIVLCIFIWRFIKSKKLDIKIRVVGSILTVVIMYLLNSTLYQNATVNSKLYVRGNIYNQVNTFNSKGFLYSFIYTYNTNKISRPDDYDINRVENKINEFEQRNLEELQEETKPHIIMIMGEAYSEMALIEDFDFTGYVDPMENYKKVKEESIYGEIVVPNLGGGTADTEFDVLTGLSTRHLRGAPFAYRLVSDRFEALPSVLDQIGYYSAAIHPGYSWFYNRQNVFRYFGFERLIFMDEFPAEATKGMYVDEVVTTEKIIKVFEDNLAENPGTPIFDFCVTIQNHGPYKDKYLVDTNFSTTKDISDDDINAISNYYEGLIDADIQIKELTEYFEASDEPVVLVFFGDHLPAFTQDVYNAFYPDIYEEGSFESLSRLYKTPFIIWQNSAAKTSTNIDRNYERLIMPENMIISSNYLGAYVMELLGYNGISPFIDYVNEMRALYPVIFESQSFNIDGISSLYLSDEEKDPLILYRDWEFYKIFDLKE